jgi:hypothetical protein
MLLRLLLEQMGALSGVWLKDTSNLSIYQTNSATGFLRGQIRSFSSERPNFPCFTVKPQQAPNATMRFVGYMTAAVAVDLPPIWAMY